MAAGRRLVVLLALAAGACGGGPPPDRVQDSAAVAETPLPDTLPLVVLEQSGGIAGAESELTIFRTGEVTLAQQPAPGGIAVRRWTLARADYDAIAALLASPGFRALDAEYLPADTCCDRITYLVTVPGADGSRTVRTMDAAQQPEVLVELLERFRALEATAPQ